MVVGVEGLVDPEEQVALEESRPSWSESHRHSKNKHWQRLVDFERMARMLANTR